MEPLRPPSNAFFRANVCATTRSSAATDPAIDIPSSPASDALDDESNFIQVIHRQVAAVEEAAKAACCIEHLLGTPQRSQLRKLLSTRAGGMFSGRFGIGVCPVV